MRFWEEDLKKYEKRVSKIAANPDTTKLKSNQLLYEIWRDHRRDQLRAWDAGERFCYVGGISFRLVRALGFQPTCFSMEGDRASKLSERYFDFIRSRGYPEHACECNMVGLGMVLSGEMPPPALAAAANYPCDPEGMGVVALGRVTGCPSFLLDTPPVNNKEALDYTTGQLEEFIQYVEEKVPGARYDEGKLVEYQALWQRQHQALREIYELKKTVPCPVGGHDVFRLPPFDIVDDPRVAQYAEMFRDELRDRVKKGYAAVPGEKLRVAWLVSGPYFADPWSFLAKRGVSVPFFEFGMAGYAFGFYQPPYGGKLSPLEEEARFTLSNFWGGSIERRVENVLRACQDLKIDALVHYELWGCSMALGTSKILADRAMKELGIPSLFLEGSSMDATKINMVDFETKLDNFVSVCINRKGLN